MMLNRGSIYLAKWSFVVTQDIASRVDLNNLLNTSCWNFDRAGVTAARGNNISYATVMNVDNLILADKKQIDLIIRFTVGNGDVDSLTLDDKVALAWNVSIQNSRLPTNNDSRPGALFSACSRMDTSQATGGNIFSVLLGRTDYEQVCSEYARVANLNAGSIGPASIVDRLASNPVEASTQPSLVGANLNQSTDIQTLARDGYNSAARTVRETLNTPEGEGMNGNDIKFIVYASVTIVGALVAVKVLKEVRRI